MATNDNINRREFLKKIGIVWAGTIWLYVLWRTWKEIIDLIGNSEEVEYEIVGDIFDNIDSDFIKNLPETDNKEFNNFWNNEEHFKKRKDNLFKKYKILRQDWDKKRNKYHTIKEDGWLNFVVVQRWDNISTIRRDLIKWLDKFKYLKDDSYDSKTRWFNTPANKLPVNSSIPIPIDIKYREMDDKYFFECCKIWVNLLLHHKDYRKKIWHYIDKIGLDNFCIDLTALARSESTVRWEEIWYYELHRYEHRYSCYSYSAFHILMAKGFEWYDARFKLWITEWQTYHPVFASVLCCIFLLNKRCENGEKLISYLPISDDSVDKISRYYNGRNYKTNKYDTKLMENKKIVSKSILV